ncbi:unnamed protein product [Brassicogethes aeneus]|uniref:Anoctamin n=1 Tax=Brassicogethes aeneus TaxID=1431903 RepID=A0A9P0BMY9_BRAAE|nr:unnamed protein product [Brassicogethes aeneus]
MNMYDINSLIKSGSLETAYPLHTGTYKWTVSGPLTDRQLLYEFWARPKRWYKEHPNNVIEKYLGTEYAFYYKFLALYTCMLIIPAFCSLIVIVYGFASMNSKENMLSKEICQSDKLICPLSSRTKYFYAKGLCGIFEATYIIFNTASIVFAIAISLWSAVLVEMWKRVESTNQLKWNVKNMEQDLTMRMEYKERAHYREVADGTLEPFVPLVSWLLRTTATVLTVVSAAVLMVLLGITFLVLRFNLFRVWEDSSAYTTVGTFSEISSIFIVDIIIAIKMIVLQKIYYKICLMITNFEIPRTEIEFDNSYIYKCYILDCVNNFGGLIFIGFFMGKALDHPAKVVDNPIYEPFYRKCAGLSCAFEMAILQLTIWLIRTCHRMFTKLVIPYLTVKRKLQNSKFSNEKLKQWESDYLLNTSERYLIAHECLDIVSEYGFVTFFISSFPLAPLCGFFTNILHLRINAYKTITLYRRPNARKVPKLVCFSKLLQVTTYFGIIANAAMIAFNSDFVPKEIFRMYYNASLEGISEQQFSKIDTSKVYSYYDYKVDEEICYYNDIRDENQKKNLEYWWILAIRFAALLAIEHVVFLIQGFLSYMIPDVPYSVKEEIAHQQKIKREQGMREAETSFIKDRQKVIKDSERFVLIK